MMPEGSYDPALHDLNAYFHLGFVARLVRPGRHNGSSIMLRHLLVGTVQIRLIAAGAVYPGTWIIGNH